MTATKVTLTLPHELLAVVDRFVTEHPGHTRSGVCAGALRDWIRAVQDAEIERYYATLSEAERDEDRDWASTAATNAGRLWS